MVLSDEGLKLIKDSEGFREEAYQDTGGVWTVGYGTTRINGRAVQKGDKVDELFATVLLLEDIASAKDSVKRLVKVPLTQSQFDSLVDFVYNLGETQFSKSTLLRKLNNKDYVGASEEFPRWVYDNNKVQPGLVTRRKKERELFLR